jgi:hypothetical protein
LLLLDVSLPNAVGAGSLARRAAFLRLPMILMSAAIDARQDLARLPYPLLCKPFRMSDMHALVQRELWAPPVVAVDPDRLDWPF